MKHKVFLGALLLIFTLGTAVLADYTDPVSSAPNGNTPDVLKTQSATARTYEKLGNGDGVTFPSKSLFTNGPYFGVTNSNSQKIGAYSDKFVVQGATGVINGQNLLVMTDLTASFDQYINSVKFRDKISNTDKTAKPLEAIVAGRYVSPVLITSDIDISQANSNNFTLELRNASGFNPTTNIGLGNSCNLYYYDIGSSIDGVNYYGSGSTVYKTGGCPAGSYMSSYKGQLFGGTPTANSNTNGVVVATCTEFNPSATPVNTGHCDNGRYWTNLVHVGKSSAAGGLCKYTAASNTTSYPSGSPTPATFTGKNVKYQWYVYNNGNYGVNPKAYTAISGATSSSYTDTCSNARNGSFWLKVVVYDDYGQYAEAEQ